MRASLIFCALAIALTTHVTHARDRSTKVKAVFLYKFLEYAKWPEEVEPKKGNKAVLCTVGGDMFEGLLDVIGKKRKKPYKIRHLSSMSASSGCHILYVAHGKSFSSLASGPIMTVGEQRGFARSGGMIEMRETNKKIKLTINIKAIREKGMNVSSHLLDIAEVIR